MGGMGGWGVPTEYLVAPVLNWTGLGCDNIQTRISGPYRQLNSGTRYTPLGEVNQAIGRIRQVAIWISVTVTSWRSESSNVSLVVLDKLIFVKKKSIIDGAVQVESLLITDNMNSKVVSFLKESSRSKRLHIDGTDFITNCKG